MSITFPNISVVIVVCVQCAVSRAQHERARGAADLARAEGEHARGRERLLLLRTV